MRILTPLTAALTLAVAATASSMIQSAPTTADHAVVGFAEGTKDASGLSGGRSFAPDADDGPRRPASSPRVSADGYAFFPPNRIDMIAASWDRSVPVTFLIARRQARPRMFPTIMETFRRARVQTGIRFTYGGRAATSKPVGTADQPVVIVDFGTADTHPRLAKYNGEIFAVGGPLLLTVGEQSVFTGGQVTIDVNTTQRLHPGFRTGRLGNTLLHEVGHVLGLTHVNAPRQLMAPGSIRANIKGWFQDGDLRGLRRLIHD